jgi:tetratricopeptide (TPR) repeat protein
MKKILIIFSLFVFVSTLFAESEYDKIISEGRKYIFKDNKKALEIFEKAKKTDPLFPLAYIFIGIIKYHDDNINDAGLEFKKGVSLTKDKEVKDSYIKSIDELTSKFKSDEEFNLFKEGFSLNENKQSKKAIEVLLKAININPNNSKLYYELAYAYTDLKDVKNAIYYLDKGRNINPVNDKILNELQYCYTQLKNQDKINEIVMDRVMIGGNERSIYHELGFAYANNKEYDKSVAIYEKLLNKYPDYYISYYTLGSIYLTGLKNKEKAKYNFEKFLNNVDKMNDFNIKGYNKEDLIKSTKKMIKECN